MAAHLSAFTPAAQLEFHNFINPEGSTQPVNDGLATMFEEPATMADYGAMLGKLFVKKATVNDITQGALAPDQVFEQLKRAALAKYPICTGSTTYLRNEAAFNETASPGLLMEPPPQESSRHTRIRFSARRNRTARRSFSCATRGETRSGLRWSR